MIFFFNEPNAIMLASLLSTSLSLQECIKPSGNKCIVNRISTITSISYILFETHLYSEEAYFAMKEAF